MIVYIRVDQYFISDFLRRKDHAAFAARRLRDYFVTSKQKSKEEPYV